MKLPPLPPLIRDELHSFKANEEIDFPEDEIIQLFFFAVILTI
jgi:hypothetical protein